LRVEIRPGTVDLRPGLERPSAEHLDRLRLPRPRSVSSWSTCGGMVATIVHVSTDASRSHQNTPCMRSSTTVKDARRPIPENSAVETNWAVSEFCDANEEMPAGFGMTALQIFGGQKTPVPEMSDNQSLGAMRLLAQCQSAAGGAGRQLTVDII
jgi:hypothetical protein